MTAPLTAQSAGTSDSARAQLPPLSSRTRGSRVLVVDDDEVVVALLERMLRSKGYHVTCATNGHEASILIDHEVFDIVLTDVDMPLVGGIALLKHIRISSPHVPVVFITGNPTMENAVEAMKNSISGYIAKPFDIDDVMEVVGRSLKMSRIPHLVTPSAADTQKTENIEKRRLFDSAITELFMSYQPIVRWSTRSIYSYEALMRTREKGVPHPGVFLDLAESLGCVKELGRNVRRKVAEQLAISSAELIFANLHPEELLDDSLYDPQSELAQSAHRVVLEVTERENLHGMKDARERIATLKKMGYRIAIDDIGAGYSGLNSFVDLEPHLVKIDMGLVRGVDTCSTRQKLVSSLLVLARDLQIDVVAEGVETVAERDTLISLGCDLLQGYFFARPGNAFPTATFEQSA